MPTYPSGRSARCQTLVNWPLTSRDAAVAQKLAVRIEHRCAYNNMRPGAAVEVCDRNGAADQSAIPYIKPRHLIRRITDPFHLSGVFKGNEVMAVAVHGRA